ncbi:TonB-dependent receptor [Seonamhaeicola algicola]|uniref:TonB-dependent receptor n=1 Tax=Seonamhaeicola algicola TaxID=1719036 RepID=A0A5C7AFN7_9FLAO|nr:TonB-dependent receptor [Seonamhaeicola algicola]TXE07241.1 TonB-dependent receptor [Seonamhaeicola algicola]
MKKLLESNGKSLPLLNYKLRINFFLILIVLVHLGAHANEIYFFKIDGNIKYSTLIQVDDKLSQIREVNGVVTDDDGFPLPGVSIIVKGETIGTTTDFDGNYSINVAKGSTLVFSYVGFISQEILIQNQTKLDIKLTEDLAKLDEVVVVGYVAQKKSDVTGSVARADVEAFADQPNTSIVQSLQGSVAGLNVGAVNSAGGSPTIEVRGRNTFAVDNDNKLVGNVPLIVLDGVIYRGSLADINPADIASIDILKDASSQAIYGSQAANGVILVTSKRGKRGDKPKINISSYYSIDSPANRLQPANRQGYLDNLRRRFYDQAFLGPNFTEPNPNFDIVSTFPYQSIIDGYNNGTDTNWLDLVTQDAYIHNFNINVSGSTEKTNYFLSAGRTEQKGYVRNDNYDRINLRANFENKVTDWLTVGMQTSLTEGDYSGVEANLLLGNLYSPLIAPYNEDGSLNTDPIGIDRSPLLRLEIEQLDKRLNLFGNFYATFKLPIKGLKYKINHGISYRTHRDFRFDKNGNNFEGTASKYNAFTTDRTTDNLLTYTTTLNDMHNLDVTLLYGFEERKGENTTAESGTFLNKALGYNALESGVGQQFAFSGAWDERSIYQMGRLNYKYNNKYLVTFTVRRDGFSGFGTETKFGTFPSLALGWTLSEEAFIEKALPWVNSLKFRASYGQTGNRTVGRYDTLAQTQTDFLYVFGDKPAFGQFISSLGNNDLSWETTTGLNLGLDFSILENRLSGNVNYYNTTTEGILYEVEIPRITGFEKITTNLGEVANKGLELSISSLNIQTDNFTWKSTVNFSTNKNEVVSVLGKDDDGDGKEDDLIQNNLFIGESIGAVYDFVDTGRIYQIGDDIPDGFNPGNRVIADLNIDNAISEDGDRKILGRTEPAYRFSVFNEFKYKNLSLSVFINSIQGGKDGYLGQNTPTATEYRWRSDNASTYNVVNEFKPWSPANPNAPHAGIFVDDPNPVTTRHKWSDRSFVRLQDVRLSYSFPDSLLKDTFFDQLRIFATGKNLATWTKWEGIDPETGAGFNLGARPVMTSYSVGINLTF